MNSAASISVQRVHTLRAPRTAETRMDAGSVQPVQPVQPKLEVRDIYLGRAATTRASSATAAKRTHGECCAKRWTGWTGCTRIHPWTLVHQQRHRFSVHPTPQVRDTLDGKRTPLPPSLFVSTIYRR